MTALLHWDASCAARPASTTRSRQAIRALYGSGLFQDVQLQQDGQALIIVVRERPSISTFKIEGNDKIGGDELNQSLKDMGLADGELFKPEDICFTIAAMLTLYGLFLRMQVGRHSGFFRYSYAVAKQEAKTDGGDAAPPVATSIVMIFIGLLFVLANYGLDFAARSLHHLDPSTRTVRAITEQALRFVERVSYDDLTAEALGGAHVRALAQHIGRYADGDPVARDRQGARLEQRCRQ